MTETMTETIAEKMTEKRINKLTTNNFRNIIQRICNNNKLNYDEVVADLETNDYLPNSFNKTQTPKKSSEEMCSSSTKDGNKCKKHSLIGETMCAQHLKITNSPTATKKVKKTSDVQCEHVVGEGEKSRQCKNKAQIGKTVCHNH